MLLKKYTQEKAISFCGIPNSRNVLCLQIVLKRAARPSAGNTSAWFPWIKRPQILFWLCTKASQTFSGTFRTFRTFSGTSLNLTRRVHQCTPELFWAEDPISLRCWGKKTKCANSYSFGHFNHQHVILWCRHRHGPLQTLKPCFWTVK